MDAPVSFDRSALRGVVFDLDGTLIDSYQAITQSLNHARARFGQPPLAADFVRRQVGRGLEQLVAEWVGPDAVGEGVRLFRERYAEVVEAGTTLLPGVAEALPRLRAAGWALGLASNKPARFSDPILRRFGLRECFQSVAGPDTAGSTKPDPAMIAQCLEQMRLRASQALYVGDMPLDVESGRRAGLAVMLVSGGSADEATLRATGCPVFKDVASLTRRLLEPGQAQGEGQA